jgi:hypothetical protein
MDNRGGKTEYVNLDDLEDVLTVREKAERHLKTWPKKRLIQQLVLSSKEGWLERWAAEYKAAGQVDE